MRMIKFFLFQDIEIFKIYIYQTEYLIVVSLIIYIHQIYIYIIIFFNKSVFQ